MLRHSRISSIVHLNSLLDHGLLLGLTDNDHTQYVNAVSDTGSINLTLTGQSISGVVIPGGVDHGSLAGLGDDDHAQYIIDTDFTQDSGFLVGTGAGTFQEETGNTARTSLNLGTGDSPTFAGLTVTKNTAAGFVDIIVENTSTSTSSLTQARARFKVGNQANGGAFGMTQFGSAFDGALFIYNIENSGIIFGTNNTRWMTLANNGFLGLGVDAPSSLLHIQRQVDNGPVDLKVENISQTVGSLVQARARFIVGTQSDGAVMGMTQFGTSFDGAAFFYNIENGGFIIGTNDTRRFDITKTGFFGFGEPAPETFIELTHATPHRTIHCSTHSNDNLGRLINEFWKGEKLDGTEFRQATVRVFHDGAADDYKSAYVIATHDAASAVDTVTDVLKIDGTQTTYIGDAGTTNYSKFEADGTLEFHGAATVWDDLVLPLDSARVPAANAPSWESFVGNLNAYAYDVDDFQEFTTELLHGYKEGSSFIFHIHGALNATTAQEEKVQFEIEYSVADMDATDGIGDVFPDGSGSLLTNELVVPDATADLSNIYITIGVDTQASFAMGATIKGRIRRIAKSAGGNELTGDMFVTQVGVHFEKNTVGSRTELTK